MNMGKPFVFVIILLSPIYKANAAVHDLDPNQNVVTAESQDDVLEGLDVTEQILTVMDTLYPQYQDGSLVQYFGTLEEETKMYQVILTMERNEEGSWHSDNTEFVTTMKNIFTYDEFKKLMELRVKQFGPEFPKYLAMDPNFNYTLSGSNFNAFVQAAMECESVADYARIAGMTPEQGEALDQKLILIMNTPQEVWRRALSKLNIVSLMIKLGIKPHN